VIRTTSAVLSAIAAAPRRIATVLRGISAVRSGTAKISRATAEILRGMRWTPIFGPRRRAAKFEPASSLYASSSGPRSSAAVASSSSFPSRGPASEAWTCGFDRTKR
jgi:hypothetical protein